MPLLMYFALYRSVVYIFLSHWSYKDWGYVVLLIATVARTIRLFVLVDTANYLQLLRWRFLGYDVGSTLLAPVIFLPVMGSVLVMQPEFLLMLFGYCCVVVGTKLLFEHLWTERPAN